MSPMIEKAEVVSFRLEVPLAALEKLPDELGALPLTMESEDAARLLVVAGESTLEFRPQGRNAVLTGVTIAQDERGLFFHRVLGPLMVQHRGDLHIRLCWNVPERNSHGEHAEVRISRGVSTYPGLATLKNLLPPGNRLLADPQSRALLASAEAQPSGAAEPEVPLSAEEQEIERLLEEGRKSFDEYQRLKNKGQSQTA